MLNQLKPVEGARHTRKRKGQGVGSGLGKTAGVVKKVKTAVQVVAFVQDSKEDKSLYSNVYQSVDLRT